MSETETCVFFVCQYCSFTSTFEFLLKRHVKRCNTAISRITFHCHSTTLTPSSVHKETSKTYNCKPCKFKTHSKLILMKHSLKSCKSLFEQFCCDYCEFTTNFKNVLKRHILHKHTPDEDIEWFQCAHCSYKAKRKSTLIFHISRKHDTKLKRQTQISKLNKCEHWSYTSKSENDLNIIQSKREHSNDDNWIECEDCDYKATLQAQMTRHVTAKHTHHTENAAASKWHECDSCTFKSLQKGHLDRHISSVHGSTADKTFECDVCGYHTSRKDIFSRHYKTHDKNENLKIFECEQCSYKAKRRDVLQQHMQNIHDIGEEFNCEHCDYKTRNKRSLKKHIISKHTADKDVEWFKCELCSYKGKVKGKLTEHIKRMHQEKTLKK